MGSGTRTPSQVRIISKYCWQLTSTIFTSKLNRAFQKKGACNQVRAGQSLRSQCQAKRIERTCLVRSNQVKLIQMVGKPSSAVWPAHSDASELVPPKKKKSFAKIQMDVSRIPELQNSRVRIDQFGRLLGSLRNTHMTVIGCACVCVCARVCVSDSRRIQ